MMRVLVLVLDGELAQRFDRIRRHETRYGLGLLRNALAKRLLREAIEDHEELYGWRLPEDGGDWPVDETETTDRGTRMKPIDLVGKLIMKLPEIIDAVGSLVESAGKATRRLSRRPPAGTAEAEARYQRTTRHYSNHALRGERCVFCGVLLADDNRDSKCPGVQS